MKTQISWMSHVEAYLAHRRDLGLKLTNDETRLRSFARFADQVSTADHLMVALAIAWARASRRPRPLTWARRIKVLRGFARFCQRLDPPPRFRHAISSVLLTSAWSRTSTRLRS